MHSNRVVTLFTLACAALIGTAMAADPPKPASAPATKAKEHMEKITLDVRGAENAGSAKVLTDALSTHGVKATLHPSKDQPVRVATEVNPTTDLGAAAKAVAEAKMPEKSKAAPALDLVLFGKFDKDAAKKATTALEKIKGVDAKHSMTEVNKGEISVRLVGGSQVTADEIIRAFQAAGIRAELHKT
jgi:hypothetical protein